jgi:putative restriction endonuclease
MSLDIDDAVRIAAFAFLAEQAHLRGELWPPVLPLSVLQGGFTFERQKVDLLFAGRGIFKPRMLSMPLSITTRPPELDKPAPYDDTFGYGHLIYRYQGTSATSPDNAGLREAMRQKKPLVYFRGIVKGVYLAVWPVQVVGDHPADLSFQVAFDPGDAIAAQEMTLMTDDAQRTYALQLVKKRLHQEGFRERVLAAYKRSCAVCQLRHKELLDAAHILGDTHPRGEPIVPNGLALCKLHHAAFDNNLIGVRPDRVLEVRRDILGESDGPMLLHGLQGIHGSTITVPRDPRLRPAPDRLEERYEEFRRAS